MRDEEQWKTQGQNLTQEEVLEIQSRLVWKKLLCERTGGIACFRGKRHGQIRPTMRGACCRIQGMLANRQPAQDGTETNSHGRQTGILTSLGYGMKT